MLKYAFRENLLTKEPNIYMAQTADICSFNLEEIIAVMMQRGSSLTEGDIRSALKIYHDVISDLIADGNAVNTPIMTSSLSISGNFEGTSDSFDHLRHQINVNLSAGTRLRKATLRVRTEKVEAENTSPNIAEVLNVNLGEPNKTVSPNDIVTITGKRLKFNLDNEEQGLFFVPDTGKTVHCTTYADNKPARITAQVPANLPEGNFYAEIRTKYSQGGKEYKSLKIGKFHKSLTKA